MKLSRKQTLNCVNLIISYINNLEAMMANKDYKSPVGCGGFQYSELMAELMLDPEAGFPSRGMAAIFALPTGLLEAGATLVDCTGLDDMFTDSMPEPRTVATGTRAPHGMNR